MRSGAPDTDELDLVPADCWVAGVLITGFTSECVGVDLTLPMDGLADGPGRWGTALDGRVGRRAASWPCGLIVSPVAFDTGLVLRALRSPGNESARAELFIVSNKDVLEAEISVLGGTLAAERERWREPSLSVGLIEI